MEGRRKLKLKYGGMIILAVLYPLIPILGSTGNHMIDIIVRIVAVIGSLILVGISVYLYQVETGRRNK